MSELAGRLILAGLGLIFGMVPMIYGYMKKQVVLGAVALVACVVLSVAGLPYLSIPVAALAFYGIYALCNSLEEKQQKANRSAYKKRLKEQLETPEGRLSGYIENRNTANTAWPPVTSCVDEEAAEEFRQLTQNDTEKE
jgi:flagellar biosynthesis component FlhA